MWIRLLRAFFRGIRPIRLSLDSIATSLHTLVRIQQLRLRLEHNEILPAEGFKPAEDDLTEVSFDVKQPPLNPQTGEPFTEDEEEMNRMDWAEIFKPRRKE